MRSLVPGLLLLLIGACGTSGGGNDRGDGGEGGDKTSSEGSGAQGGSGASGGSRGGSGGAQAGNGPSECPPECLRPVQCVIDCSGPPVSIGCCPCLPPAKDNLECGQADSP